jgi:hypothetical protein
MYTLCVLHVSYQIAIIENPSRGHKNQQDTCPARFFWYCVACCFSEKEGVFLPAVAATPSCGSLIFGQSYGCKNLNFAEATNIRL